MIRAIGIDLGTTNTVAAQMNNRGVAREIENRRGKNITPSAIAVTPKRELLVGENAKSRPQDVIMSFKRDMGTDKMIPFNRLMYTPMELSTLVLRQVKKDVEEKLKEPVTRAVITVPAWFSERATWETREAGRMAGFFVMRTFSEPMAAALAYGVDREDIDPKTILVYDLGGGTFDISVLMVTPGNFMSMDSEGDVLLGGDDFDQMIEDYIRKQASAKHNDVPDDPKTRRALRVAAEIAKVELSDQMSSTVSLPALGNGVNIEEEITREQFDSMLMPWILGPRKENGKKSTMELVHIARGKSHLTNPDSIDYVLLVGGSTYIPLVRRVLAAEFGEEKILQTVNPMLGVAHGAAIETVLIDKIDCPECHHKNSLDALKCSKCNTLLIGEEKIDCPICFLPSPASEKKCWKCGSELGKKIIPKAEIPLKKCPKGHENPLSATVCCKCDYVFEVGGIACKQCGHVNKAGALICESEECGAPLPQRIDITPKDLGIKLKNGTFSIIVPKGTPCPTESPLHKLHKIPESNKSILQIEIYSGESSVARDNEWQGELLMDLPPGIPEGESVDICIAVDADRIMVVSAKLTERLKSDGTPHDVSAQIEYIEGGVQILRDLDNLLKKGKEIYEENKTYLPEDKQKQLKVLIEEMETAKNKRQPRTIKNRFPEWEKQLSNYEASIKVPREIDNTTFWAQAMLNAARDYLSPEEKEKLESLLEETKKARKSGNLDTAYEKSKQLGEAMEAQGGKNTIVIAEVAARHPKLSPALSNKLYSTLREFKTAVHTGNENVISQKMSELMQLIEQAIEELKKKGIDITEPVD